MSANSNRVYNFNPGPAALPLEVLQQAQAELLDYQGTGMSVMEISHRSKEFEAIIQTAEADLRELLGIPANYKVMFLQGGATLQFAMIPMNFRPAGASADYIVTGTWSKTAFKEAGKLGTTTLPPTPKPRASTTCPQSWTWTPRPPTCTSPPMRPSTAWNSPSEPVPPAGVPLICDASSDFISRPIDVSKYALIYAGAQKNAGPPGVVIVIAREDMLEKSQPTCRPCWTTRPCGQRLAAQHPSLLFHLHHRLWCSSGSRRWAAWQAIAEAQPGEGRPGLQDHRCERRFLPRARQAGGPLGDEHPLPPARRRAGRDLRLRSPRRTG